MELVEQKLSMMKLSINQAMCNSNKTAREREVRERDNGKGVGTTNVSNGT